MSHGAFDSKGCDECFDTGYVSCITPDGSKVVAVCYCEAGDAVERRQAAAVRERDEARAEVERLRAAIDHAIGICEDAAAMTCDCTGYYRCNGCERRPAERADDAVEVLRDARS